MEPEAKSLIPSFVFWPHLADHDLGAQHNARFRHTALGPLARSTHSVPFESKQNLQDQMNQNSGATYHIQL